MKEGRKKEASKVKQTTKQSNTPHPRQSLFLKKKELPRVGLEPTTLHVNTCTRRSTKHTTISYTIYFSHPGTHIVPCVQSPISIHKRCGPLHRTQTGATQTFLVFQQQLVDRLFEFTQPEFLLGAGPCVDGVRSVWCVYLYGVLVTCKTGLENRLEFERGSLKIYYLVYMYTCG